jgi:hypothetical protein
MRESNEWQRNGKFFRDTGVCRVCGGLRIGNEKVCPCGMGAEVRMSYAGGTNDPALRAAHFYALARSIRSGSWARAGLADHAEAWKVEDIDGSRDLFVDLCQNVARGFAVRRMLRVVTRRRPSLQEAEMFYFRCEIAHTYWRDEFAGLMGNRVVLWLAGHTKEKVRDFLQVNRAELDWLDGQIRKFVAPLFYFGGHPAYMKAYRRTKAGVASAILRRRKHGIGYKHGHVLLPQQDAEKPEPPCPNSEGRNTQEMCKQEKQEFDQDRLEKEAFQDYCELVSTMPKPERAVLNYLTRQEDIFEAADALFRFRELYQETKGQPMSEQMLDRLLRGIFLYELSHFDRWFWEPFKTMPEHAQIDFSKKMRALHKEIESR